MKLWALLSSRQLRDNSIINGFFFCRGTLIAFLSIWNTLCISSTTTAECILIFQVKPRPPTQQLRHQLSFPTNDREQDNALSCLQRILKGSSFKCTLKASLLSSQLATTKDDCVILLYFKVTAADWKHLLTRHHPPQSKTCSICTCPLPWSHCGSCCWATCHWTSW